MRNLFPSRLLNIIQGYWSTVKYIHQFLIDNNTRFSAFLCTPRSMNVFFFFLFFFLFLELNRVSSHQIDTFEAFPRSSSMSNTFPGVDWRARICRSPALTFEIRLKPLIDPAMVLCKCKNSIAYPILIILYPDPTLAAWPGTCSDDPL